jgi:hypothetical protein
MKMTFGVVASTAFAAGLISGVVGGNLIPLAHAASDDRVILIDTDSEIATKCNFDKTIVKGPKYYACVSN